MASETPKPIDWRKVDHERAQRAAGAQWPTQDTLALWKAHGGEWHGPHVETVTMPMYLLTAFLDAYAAKRQAADLAAVRDDAETKGRRIAELEKALAPFAEAGRHIPGTWTDTRPAAHVNSDARHPGTVTTIPASDFRRAARTGAPDDRR